jgi:hypothetical protein
MKNIHKPKTPSAEQIAQMADKSLDVSRHFTNHGKMMPAISEALREKISHLGRGRLAKECAKLNPKAEQALADEGLSGVLNNWSKY